MKIALELEIEKKNKARARAEIELANLEADKNVRLTEERPINENEKEDVVINEPKLYESPKFNVGDENYSSGNDVKVSEMKKGANLQVIMEDEDPERNTDHLSNNIGGNKATEISSKNPFNYIPQANININVFNNGVDKDKNSCKETETNSLVHDQQAFRNRTNETKKSNYS